MDTETAYMEPETRLIRKRSVLRRLIKENTLEDAISAENGILPKGHFVNSLRREKRIADRSKASLSIVMFSVRPNNPGDQRKVWQFVKYLNKVTRETDIKGWLDGDVLAIILPHTDKMGANIYLQKILQGNGHPTWPTITGTYPDYIFQQLLNDGERLPDFFPLDLEREPNVLRSQQSLKRAIDVLGSLLALILLSPLMLMIALAVKASSPGPVIFKQTRLGMKGVRFSFYKFRSMYSNVDDQIHRQYVSNLIEGHLDKIDQGDGKRPFFKIKSDSRVTKLGRMLRKLSLDELPQLFNVLKGEMSLVGPRPPIPYEIEKYEPWHLRRILEVKPGMTGLWQVNGRSRTSFEEMVRLDLRYIRNWSLWLDLKILLKTVREVLHPKGAA